MWNFQFWHYQENAISNSVKIYRFSDIVSIRVESAKAFAWLIWFSTWIFQQSAQCGGSFSMCLQWYTWTRSHQIRFYRHFDYVDPFLISQKHFCSFVTAIFKSFWSMSPSLHCKTFCDSPCVAKLYQKLTSTQRAEAIFKFSKCKTK